ncbi:MAG: metallophosphoesterase [Anaerolineae bacterium]|nr:metallophosphoesterase [Anaerolineae bacterium]MBT7073108.1 metallophosphoesterase [Anaerolineae bacterium]MBT7323919.1 metallophosphoesterase [Anaerolineae bacterium]
MKILSVSDKVIPFLYSPEILEKIHDVDLVIACGDLPYYYQEYIIKKLRVPLFFVRGNHDPVVEYDANGERKAPRGGKDLHRRVVYQDELILAGVEGCNRYNRQGNFQYTTAEMWMNVFRLVPELLINRLLYGRALDIFVTHAAPLGIHDKPDWTHRGIKAFNWLIRVFKPKYHFHGHNHVYKLDTITETQVGETLVINTYGYKVKDLEL